MSEEPDGDPFHEADRDERVDVDEVTDSPERIDQGERIEPAAGTAGPETGDDPFEQMEVGDIDEEAVWSELGADDGDESLADLSAAIEVDGEAEEAVVPKNQFCERCEHFSEPPDVSCGHDGTEIREFVDVEHLRVVDCPVVENRARLEREG